VLHSQLRQLWETHPNLKERAELRGHYEIAQKIGSVEAADIGPSDEFERGLREYAANYNRNGFNFLPLVAENLCLRCSLDILFLRREEKDYILQGGDIDGRLKTLFDALRIITKQDELPTGATPTKDEDPFFCLLEDDKLISEVHVRTGMTIDASGRRTNQ
jgi:hypothetical protein